jgi:hypothetical protein
LNFLETEDSRSRAALALAIVSVSTAAIMIRMCESGPLTVAFYRLLFTTLMVMPWALARDMDCFKGLGWKDWAKLAGIGLVLAAHFALWVSAVGMTSIANSAVLVTMHPIFVAAISVALLKESPPRSALLGAGIAFVGVAIMFAGGLSGGSTSSAVAARGKDSERARTASPCTDSQRFSLPRWRFWNPDSFRHQETIGTSSSRWRSSRASWGTRCTTTLSGASRLFWYPQPSWESR